MLFIKKSGDGSIVYKYEAKSKKTKPCYDPILLPCTFQTKQKISSELCDAIVDDLVHVAQTFESGKYKITWNTQKLRDDLQKWVKKSS